VFRARWATVEAVLERRGDRQRLAVRLEGEEAPAINYVSLTGEAVRGDRVVLNTTAVALGLESGGLHFVMAIEGRLPPDPVGRGHIMKLRYTPWQFPVRAVEEDLADAPLDLGGCRWWWASCTARWPPPSWEHMRLRNALCASPTS